MRSGLASKHGFVHDTRTADEEHIARAQRFSVSTARNGALVARNQAARVHRNPFSFSENQNFSGWLNHFSQQLQIGKSLEEKKKKGFRKKTKKRSRLAGWCPYRFNNSGFEDEEKKEREDAVVPIFIQAPQANAEHLKDEERS
jgi:hypothetical protein